MPPSCSAAVMVPTYASTAQSGELFAGGLGRTACARPSRAARSGRFAWTALISTPPCSESSCCASSGGTRSILFHTTRRGSRQLERVQMLSDGGDLLRVGDVRGVDDVQQQRRVFELFERGAKRATRSFGRSRNEADGVGDDDLVLAGKAQAPAGGVEGANSLSSASTSLSVSALSSVDLPRWCNRRSEMTGSLLAVAGAAGSCVLAELLDAALERGDAARNTPAVDLELGLARAAAADCQPPMRRESEESACHQARQHVLELGDRSTCSLPSALCARCAKMSRMSWVRSSTFMLVARRWWRAWPGERFFVEHEHVGGLLHRGEVGSSSLPVADEVARSASRRICSSESTTSTPAVRASSCSLAQQAFAGRAVANRGTRRRARRASAARDFAHDLRAGEPSEESLPAALSYLPRSGRSLLDARLAGRARSRAASAPVLVAVCLDRNRSASEASLRELHELARTAGVEVVDSLLQIAATRTRATSSATASSTSSTSPRCRRPPTCSVFDKNLSPGRPATSARPPAIEGARSHPAHSRHLRAARAERRRTSCRSSSPISSTCCRAWCRPTLRSRASWAVESAAAAPARPSSRSTAGVWRDRINRARAPHRSSSARTARPAAAPATARSCPVISNRRLHQRRQVDAVNALTEATCSPKTSCSPPSTPPAGACAFPAEHEVIITDTVGFIRDLPKDLVAAFRRHARRARRRVAAAATSSTPPTRPPGADAAVESILHSLELSATPRLVGVEQDRSVPPDEAQQLLSEHGGVLISASSEPA